MTDPSIHNTACNKYFLDDAKHLCLYAIKNHEIINFFFQTLELYVFSDDFNGEKQGKSRSSPLGTTEFTLITLIVPNGLKQDFFVEQHRI